jgi:hypothetical protein
MAGILKVDNIRNSANTVNMPTTYFKRRTLQRWSKWFKGGLWNPSNTYWEIPGSWINLTPMSDTSRITYSFNAPVGHVWNSHSISHWIFYAYGLEQCRFSKSCTHLETAALFQWEVLSQGAGKSLSMGFYARQYNNGNHGVHFNARRYRDGSNVNEPVGCYVSCEEYESA